MNRFRLGVILRVCGLLLVLAALTLVVLNKPWVVTSICLVAVLLVALFDLIFYVERTNRELSRFLSAVRHSDFTTRFGSEKGNPSFRHLHESLNEVMVTFQKIKAEKEAHYRYLQAVIEHIGIGIISFDSKGEVQLLNEAARKLLQLPHLRQVQALSRISPELAEALVQLPNGTSQMVQFSRLSDQLTLTVRVSELSLQGEPVKIASLQNIQSEMEAQELEAWQKLIRVLTHEMMNSLTPVTSLSSTLSVLVESELSEPGHVPDPETIQDLRTGLRTIEKRSQGMLHFVQDYRKLMRVPQPHFQNVDLNELLARVITLLKPELQNRGMKLSLPKPEGDLHLQADPELLEQVLINLIKNAMEACHDCAAPCVEVQAYRGTDNRIKIEVADNGAGIPPDLIGQIFVPFYTTKEQGSGIGLSLSRQIMTLHRGSIRVTSALGERTVFVLTF
jgi:two-component system nitrogen regulation sensor histidine kinase NtrY